MSFYLVELSNTIIYKWKLQQKALHISKNI